MNSLKNFIIAALLTVVTIHSSGSSAQTASGTAPAACTQNGQTLTCTTTTTYTLPSGVILQGQTTGSSFALASGTVTPAAPSGCSVSPSSLSVALSAAPTLTVLCSAGSGNYTYQWNRNGSNISGATGSTYTLSASSDTAVVNTATYSVLVANSVGSNFASAASVSVSTQFAVAPSSCSVTPQSSNVSVGASQTLSASCASGTSPFTYAWYKGASQIAGANSSTYTLSNFDTASAGSQTYRVDISNSAGTSSATSIVTANAASACSNNGSVNSVINVNTLYKQVESSILIGLGNTYVIRLDVPASSSTVNGLTALLSHAEGTASQRAFRNLVLSPCIGDFTSSAAVPLSTNATAATIDLAINDPGRGVPNLTTGTWYVNIKNVACTANTRCDVVIDWLHY